jgi:hypothetical protein
MTDLPNYQEDNLAPDLLSLLKKAGLDSKQQQAILLELLPYLVIRDHKIFSHAYNAGRASV